jgi:PKD repeat protein
VVAFGGTPSYNYLLNGGSIQSNGDFEGLTNGSYEITVVDVNGCDYTGTFTVEASTLLPIANFTHTVSGDAVLFTNTSENDDSYSWTFGDGGSSSDESPVHVYDEPGDYVISLTVTNDCGSDTYTTTISTINTSIVAANEVAFSIYPNPAKFELFVVCEDQLNGGLNVEVYSVSGQLLNSVSNQSFDGNGRMKLNVSGLSDGMYFLRLTNENNQSVHRFDIIK